MASDQSQNPSLIGGHAQYVKGVVEETVGSVTGANSFQEMGANDKKIGVDAMKAASENRDPNASGMGKAEELAGKAVGCEGMEKEGAQSKSE